MDKLNSRKFLLWILTFILSSNIFATPFNLNNTFNSSQILSPTEAFKVTADLDKQQQNVRVNFAITPNYYIYKDRLKITAIPKDQLDISHIKPPASLFIQVPEMTPQGKLFMQSEAVLTGNFSIKLPWKNPGLKQNIKLTIVLQGCDGKSICYPPQTYNFTLNPESPTAVPVNLSSTSLTSSSFHKLYTGEVTSSTLLARLNIFEIMALFFVAGIAIALTPCMYPLYPIALTTIMGNTQLKSPTTTVKLVLCYIQGLALIYVIMGAIAAFSGKLLTTVMQTPWFILTCSGILLLLGLAMFDLLEVKLSNKIQNYFHIKAAKLIGGKYTTVFIMGIFSSLLLGPCITPPLIIAIGFIANKGSVLFGVLGLYVIALGMGMPILLLATLGNEFLPKSGSWMTMVKYLLGTLIIVTSIYLAYPFIDLGNSFISIGMLCFIVALVFLIINYTRAQHLQQLVHKITPILIIFLGLGFTLYGVKHLFKDVQDLKVNSGTMVNRALNVDANTFRVVTTKVELDNLISQSKKPIIIDIYANWCTVCKEMTVKTFTDSQVQVALANYTRIKFDISSNLPEYYTVLQQYDLYGPPAILILNPQHQVIDKLLGFVKSKTLIQHLSPK